MSINASPSGFDPADDKVVPLESPARRLLREAQRDVDARLSEPKPAWRDRRGPFRPDQLVPTRLKVSGRIVAGAIRITDVAVMIGLALYFAGLSYGGGPLAAPLGAILPYVVGIVLSAITLKEFGAYAFPARETLSTHLVRTAASLGLTGLAGAAALLITVAGAEAIRNLTVWFIAVAAATYLVHVIAWLIVGRWRQAGRLTPNIVVVGATPNAEALINSLLISREANVLGVFDDRLSRVPEDICGVPVLGDTRALVAHRVTPFVDRVVITVPSTAQRRVRQIIERLRILPNEVSLFLEFDSEHGDRAVSRLADAPIAQVCGLPRDDARAAWKRFQDLLVGGVALVFALPVMALTALAVRMDSPGPIFFRQRRHGFHNEEIVVWKFRTMRHEAADATAARQVTADDDRVTRVGRWLRRLSLDELPQILNVLKGEMSLVGPRPHAIGMKTGNVESERLVAEYAHRHRIKPGITGWAAVHGSRGPVNTAEDVRRRVAYDIEYIERQSFWLDMYIMLMTVPCLLGDRSAVR